MDNLLNRLQEIRGYHYRIWEYQRSFSMLTIRAENDKIKNHNIHLTFVEVNYVQCPFLGWVGDLYLASDDELFQELKQSGINIQPEIPKSFFKENFSLYKADSPNRTICIFGKLYKIENDVEPIYN